MRRLVILLFSHGATLLIGFALGIYLLPILTEPDSPAQSLLKQEAQSALYSTQFSRELKASDFLHWGEGKVSIKPTQIIHEGSLAPAPDYKVYLVKKFVQHEDEFLPVKSESVLVWCETFGEFITSANYR